MCRTSPPTLQSFNIPPPLPELLNGLAPLPGLISSLVPRSNPPHSSTPDMEIFFALLPLLAVLLAALRFLIRRDKQTITEQLRSTNFVQLTEVDGPEMAKFLQEMAKEKPIRFTAQELSRFTNNYSKILGSEGYGIGYKGQFPNGVDIAVKVLKRNADSNKVVEEQFMTEVSTMSRTHHINLVRLYGFCHDQLNSALVYEYMENGALDKYLFGEMHQLEWQTLCDITIGIAKGIVYLQEECQQRIIHYDIKPNNVLLDSKFSPKVADFGLAKLYNKDNTHITMTGYRGTPGYSAPELILMNQSITHKCDVYSYGMLLFEIIGRRRNAGVVGSSDSLNWFPKQVWENFEKGELGKMASACGIEENNREKALTMSRTVVELCLELSFWWILPQHCKYSQL